MTEVICWEEVGGDMLGYYIGCMLCLLKNPLFRRLNSIMHHSSTSGMHNQNQCSTLCVRQFTPSAYVRDTPKWAKKC